MLFTPGSGKLGAKRMALLSEWGRLHGRFGIYSPHPWPHLTFLLLLTPLTHFPHLLKNVFFSYIVDANLFGLQSFLEQGNKVICKGSQSEVFQVAVGTIWGLIPVS